jgi:hypothetical protein
MTGKPDDDGLAEIKRLLRSLEQTSAGDRAAPADPWAPKTKADPSRLELVPDRLPPDALIPAPAPPDMPLTVGKTPPPTDKTPAQTTSTPWPLAIALLAGAAAASGLAIWWGDPGLLATRLLGARAVGITDRTDERALPRSPVPAMQARAERPAAEAAAGKEPGGPAGGSAESAPAAGLPQRLAQAARSQSAVTDTPRAIGPSQEPRLRVPARLTAVAEQSVALPIEIDASAQASAVAIIIVKGLPAGTKLNKGTVLATGDWSLSAADATGLTMALPTSAAGRHQLTIEMRSSDVAVTASVRTTLEVSSTPARPTMADAGRPSETVTLEWLAEAKRQISVGHIASSRLLLERAADAGLGEAARLLGDTWDPAKLYALGVRGMSGDIQKAIFWYERADELGDPQAKARLLALGAR